MRCCRAAAGARPTLRRRGRRHGAAAAGAAVTPAAPPPHRRRATPPRCCRWCSRWPGSSAPRWRPTCRTLMQAAGGTLALAVAVGALVGPAQVAGRLFEFGFLRRVSPLAVARAGHARAPARRAAAVVAGRAGGGGLRHPARPGRRHHDHRQGHAAAGLLRRRRLWRAPGLDRAAGARAAGPVALAVRPRARALGGWARCGCRPR